MSGGLRHYIGAAWRESGRIIIVVAASAIALLAAGFLAAHLRGLPLHEATVDPANSEHTGLFVGDISIAGVALWAAAGAVAIFASTLVPAGTTRTMLRLIGAASLLLGLDDAVMIHEAISDRVPGGDILVALAYAGGAAALLIKGRTWFLGRHAGVLVAGGAALALSLGLDAVTGGGAPDELETILEDSFKFVGIALWATYLILKSYEEARRAQAPAAGVADVATPIERAGT